MTKTLWIDGWACNSEFKKSELSKALNTELTILPFSTWIKNLTQHSPLDTNHFDNIIFWSTGCFAPINSQQTLSNCIFLFPAFNFCGENGWNSAAISRMQRSISKGMIKKTLKQFSELLGNTTLLENKFWNQSSCQEAELLIQGLELLKSKLQTNVPFNSYTLIGKHDLLCKEGPIKLFAEQNKLITFEIDSGHWPFHSKTYQTLLNILEH
jgi:hypothetical protein